MINDFCSDNAWSVLSVSSAGEVVLARQISESMIIAKVRSYSAFMANDEIFKVYLSSISSETKIKGIQSKICYVDDRCWTLNFILIDRAAIQYVLYASCTIGNKNFVVELLFSEVLDYLNFAPQFADFIRSLEFGCISNEIATLSTDKFKLNVHAISNLVCRMASVDAAVFTGKGKYFSVSVKNDCTIWKLLKDGAVSSMLKIETEDDMHCICGVYNVDGEKSGVVEQRTILVGGQFVEVFGYWSVGNYDEIENNLRLEVIPCTIGGEIKTINTDKGTDNMIDSIEANSAKSVADITMMMLTGA